MGSQPTRIAYVTGGMGGIGTAICRRLCREGHTVIAGCGPGSARRDRWVSEMRTEGCNIRASEGNVSDWDSTRRAVDAARAEVGEIDILVNTASPGYIGTDMVRAIKPDRLERIVSGIPVKRLGEPEEIASIVAWLVSEESAFATGADFSLNGGLHMG